MSARRGKSRHGRARRASQTSSRSVSAADEAAKAGPRRSSDRPRAARAAQAARSEPQASGVGGARSRRRAESKALARVVLTTAPDSETAQRIARALVGERLAACVNVIPGVRSIYRWQGAIEDDAELLLVMKTHANRLPALARRLAVLHPYALPELVALTPSGGSERYLAWVCAETEETS